MDLTLKNADRLCGPIPRCSLAAKGLWIHLLLLMQDSPRYGYLLNPDGSACSPERIAHWCGCSVAEFGALLEELSSVQVVQRSTQGVVYFPGMAGLKRPLSATERKRLSREKLAKQRESGRCHVTCLGQVCDQIVTPSPLDPPSPSPSSPPHPLSIPIAQPPLNPPPEGGKRAREEGDEETWQSGSKAPPNLASFSPPTESDVLTACQFIGVSEEAGSKFWNHYEAQGWMTGGGVPIRNWKSKLKVWGDSNRSKEAAAAKKPVTIWEQKEKLRILQQAIEDHPGNPANTHIYESASRPAYLSLCEDLKIAQAFALELVR